MNDTAVRLSRTGSHALLAYQIIVSLATLYLAWGDSILAMACGIGGVMLALLAVTVLYQKRVHGENELAQILAASGILSGAALMISGATLSLQFVGLAIALGTLTIPSYARNVKPTQ